MLGFTGSDNQGIVGLEAKYDVYLAGNNGRILTLTDAWGTEIKMQRGKVRAAERSGFIYKHRYEYTVICPAVSIYNACKEKC